MVFDDYDLHLGTLKKITPNLKLACGNDLEL